MLKQILESNNYGYVYIDKIGGKYISNRIYEIEDEFDGELPEFDGDILADVIFKFEENILDDIDRKGLLKKGYGAVSVGLKYVSYDYKKGYKYKVDYINIFDEEGNWVDGGEKELKEYIDFIENCKEIELDIEYNTEWEWKIVYSPKALKCYPQAPMNNQN